MSGGKRTPLCGTGISLPRPTVKRKGKPPEQGLRILQHANLISQAADLVRREIGLPPIDAALQSGAPAPQPVVNRIDGRLIYPRPPRPSMSDVSGTAKPYRAPMSSLPALPRSREDREGKSGRDAPATRSVSRAQQSRPGQA